MSEPNGGPWKARWAWLVHWSDQIGKVGKAAGYVAIVIGLVYAAIDKIIGWMTAFFVLLIIQAATWIAGRLIRRSSPNVDPQMVLASPLVQPPAPEKAAFHKYREDVILDVRWRWKWKPDAVDPAPDQIAEIAPFCKACGVRIRQTDDVLRMFQDGNHFLIIDNPADFRYSASRVFRHCRLECECGETKQKFNEPYVRVIDRVKRMIEAKALRGNVVSDALETQ